MAVYEVKDFLIKVTTDFVGGTAGFSKARREIEGVGTASKKASDDAKALFDQMRRLESKDFALAFNVDAIDSMLKQLEEIDSDLEAIGKRKISVDPKARDQAREMRAIIRDQVDEYRVLAAEATKARAVEEKAILKVNKLEASLRYYRGLRNKQDAKELTDLQKKREAAAKAALATLQKENAERAKGQRFMRQDLKREINRTKDTIGGMGRTLGLAAEAVDNWGSRFDAVAGVITRLSPILRGASILIGVALVGALGALVAGLSAAVAGFAAAGAAAAAAFLPVFALFTGFMSRLGAIGQAVKAHAGAQKQVQQEQADAAERQAAEAKKVAAALDAQQDAMEGIVDANEEVTRSADDLREAEVDALREIEDAAERASDAVRDLEAAHLGVEEANLNLEEAKLRLQELGQEAGVSDEAISDMFQKFSDVDLKDTDRLKQLMAEAGQAAPGEGGIDFRKALLDVAQAKLGIKEANDRVGDSERDLQDAQKESIRLQKEGIEGVDSYRAAQERLADAQDAVGDAQERANDATQTYREALKDQRDVLSGATDAWDSYNQQVKDLSSSERLFLGDMLRLGPILKKVIQQGTDPLFKALHSMVPEFEKFVPYMAALAGGIGKDAAANMKALGDQLTSLPNLLKGLKLADLSRDMANILGGPILQNAAQAFINIATGAAPILRGILGEISVWMQDLAQSTQAFGEGGGGFELLRDAAMGFLHMIENLGRAFVAFVGAAGAQGGDFLKWIGDAAALFADWASSEGGRNRIQDFLATAIPFAEKLVKFIGKLGVLFLQAFEAAAPAVGDILTGLGVVVDLVIIVLDYFNKLPDWLKSLIVGLLLPIGLIGKLGGFTLAFLKYLGKVPGVIGKVARAMSKRLPIGALIAAFNALGQAWEFVVDVMERGWEQIEQLFSDGLLAIKALFGISSPSTVFIEIGEAIVDGLLEGLRGLGGALAAAGRAMVRRLLGPFAGMGGRLLRAITTAFGVAFKNVRSLASTAVAFGKRIVTLILNAIRDSADRVRNLGQRFLTWIGQGARSIFNRMVELGRNIVSQALNGVRQMYTTVFQVGVGIVQGLINGMKSMAGAVFTALKNLAAGIIGTIKGALGIKSPSTVMYGLGQQTMQGFINGMAWGTEKLHNFVRDKLGAQAMAALAVGGGGIMGFFRKILGDVSFIFSGRDFTEDLFAKVVGRDGETLPKYWMEMHAPGIQTPAGSIGKFILRNIGEEIAEAILGEVPGLAKGGVTTRATLAQIGERGREAVLPLSRSVMRQLAGAITAQMSLMGPMSMPRGATAGGAMGRGVTIQHQDVYLPPAPGHEQMGDVRHQAAQFAQELRRRGGQAIGGGGVS